MNLEKKVKELAYQVGFDLCGITTAEPFYNLQQVLEQRVQTRFHSEFEELNLPKRLNPRLSSPEANSIIALGKVCPPVAPVKLARGQGKIARFARGRDYHLELREAMDRLSCLLQNQLSLTPLTTIVDTGPLIDRAVAARAGIGWYGKNCSIISQGYGSWIALGQILIKEKLKPDKPQKEQCGSCDKCLQACPTGALQGPYQLNSNLCLSQLTQTKSIIPKKYRLMLGTRIYGCDTCQEVCPYNNFSGNLVSEQEEEAIDLISLLRMSNSEFRRKYKDKAYAWRGKNILQRNAIIALGNLKEKSASKDLISLLNGPNTMLRGYSAWALGRIKSPEALEALERALKEEDDPWVREEIKDALKDNKQLKALINNKR
jgi:epoxyqueuosine reductase